MSLGIFCPGEQGSNSQIDIIKKINFNIIVLNCLAPLHKVFPTISVDINFPIQIRFDFDFTRLRILLQLKDAILL